MAKGYWFVGRSVCLLSLMIAGALFSPTASADTVTIPGEGAVTDSGYVKHGDYWFKDGIAYTRTLWTFYRYQRYPRYAWIPYDRYLYSPIALPTATDPLWRLKLLSIYAAQRGYEAGLLKANVEQQNFEASVKVLGLDSVFKYAGTVGSPYPGVQTYQLSSAGVNAATIYGVRQDLDAYNLGDLSILEQGAVKVTESAQVYADKAGDRLAGLTAAKAKELAGLLAIRERGIARERALRASLAPEVHQSSSSTKVVPTPAQPQGLPSGAVLRQQLCFGCHSAAAKRVEAKLDLSDWAAVSKEQRAKVLDRLTTQDPKRLMPRDEKTGMGRRLTPEATKRILED